MVPRPPWQSHRQVPDASLRRRRSIDAAWPAQVHESQRVPPQGPPVTGSLRREC